MSQKCVKPIAGQKIKERNADAPDEDANVPYDNDNRWSGMNSNLASLDPPSQYQRLKLIQHTVRVDASSYSMNKAAINVYETPPNNETVINWNQMSDRMQPHIQTARMSMKSSISIRPGNISPGGVGCDIKHNSYDRYLARLKGSGPLRKDNLKITYGQPIKFNPADPIYGGKTVKTSIVSSLCGCGTLIGPFIENFAYSFDVIDKIITDFTPYIPIIHNDKLEYINTITIKNNKVTVNIQYVFFDNETTVDGLSFNINGLADFYNNHTANLQITTFGKIPLSRGGSQFKGLHKLPLFPLDLPTILDNTSLSYCFANVIDFNGLEEQIMTILRTELIIDTNYMFYRSAFNIPDFTLDITYIDTLVGMFQETTAFNPSIFYMNVREITNNAFYSKSNIANAKAAAPKPKPPPAAKKKLVSLLSKAKAFVGTKFTYFNANAQILGKASMRQFSWDPQFQRTSTPAEPAIMEDISQMFYQCPNFDPDRETDPAISNFQFTAAPTNIDYVFFNSPKFNAPLYAPPPLNGDNSNTLIYGNFNVTYTKSMDYAFTGTEQFNNKLNSWELPNLVNSVNVFSDSAIQITNIPNYFAFEYTFIGDSSLNNLIRNNLPIIQTDALEINEPSIIETSINTTTSSYKINFNFIFKDDGITNDGLTFENVYDFYNAHALTGLTINKFSGLNLSRNGSQFANLTIPLIFMTYLNNYENTPNIPSIIPNSSLNSCFKNTAFFNSDISRWNTQNVTDMSSMFEAAPEFNIDIHEWVVTNVSFYEKFSDTLQIAYRPQFIKKPGFIYSFNYTGTDEEVDFKQYIPIKNDNNSFNYISIITPSLSKFVVVQIIFTTDNVTGDDGLTFYIRDKKSPPNVEGNQPYIYEFYNEFTSGLTIVQYGEIPLSNSGFQFANLDAIHVSALDAPTILPNTYFFGLTATSAFNNSIDNWNIFDNNNTNWSGMFWQSISFNQDITNWDTSNVIDMSYMFNGAQSFTGNLSGWKVTKVTNHAVFATDALKEIIEPDWIS